jgi:hypothetical protein
VNGSRLEVVRVRQALSTLIDVSGMSRREIQRQLVDLKCGLDLNRLLSGKSSLKMHQLLDILRVLDVHPLELFRMVFKEPERRSPLFERVQALFASGKSPALPRSRSAEKELEEIRRRLDELTQRVEQIGARPP